MWWFHQSCTVIRVEKTSLDQQEKTWNQCTSWCQLWFTWWGSVKYGWLTIGMRVLSAAFRLALGPEICRCSIKIVLKVHHFQVSGKSFSFSKFACIIFSSCSTLLSSVRLSSMRLLLSKILFLRSLSFSLWSLSLLTPFWRASVFVFLLIVPRLLNPNGCKRQIFANKRYCGRKHWPSISSPSAVSWSTVHLQ